MPKTLDANFTGVPRLLVVKPDGKVYGVTYRWRADNSDADLLTTGAQQDFTITNADNSTRNQTWSYPSPAECIDCHNAQSSQILGLGTRQLNGNYTYVNGVTENQLAHWNNRNLFTPAFNNNQITGFDKMVALHDTSASLETRVKSVDPNDRMPPIGRSLEHTEYIAVLRQWINSLTNTLPPQDKVLLSRNKPVRSLSFEGGFVAGNAVDGDVQTRWGSEFSDPQWIEIDLETEQPISEIKLVWEAAYGSSYTIQGSLDQSQWNTLVTQTNGWH